MSTNPYFDGIDPNSAVQCADMLSLMDRRIFGLQLSANMPDGYVWLIGDLLKKRDAVAQRLAHCNARSGGAPVVPRFTIAQLFSTGGAWTYQEYCLDRGETTTLGNEAVSRLVKASGLYPFEVHAKLLEINPVVFLKDQEEPLSIYVGSLDSMREVVHALGGVLEGEEHLGPTEG